MNVPPGTLYARSTTGHIDIPPEPGRVVRFGRNFPQNDPEVHLAVGPDDRRVSRRHGELTYRGRTWWLRNTGRQLLRMPRGLYVHKSTDPLPLSPGYTWLYVKGSGQRDHLVELYITDRDRFRRPVSEPPGVETLPTEEYGPLDPDARLVLAVLGESYLHYEPDPRPRTYREAEELLSDIVPDGRWSAKRIERKVTAIRHQVHRTGRFPYQILWEEGLPRPKDNSLLHNLLRGLVEQSVLIPPDLALLDEEHGGGLGEGHGGFGEGFLG
ncbi:FHA domain-containing protein [Streptomyces sp. 4N509B]|uniref:FHA domain-containing protein n=1 Tax=Streptomyces sp. 4N509B TaxID=3457413 RepID=UPI003FD060F5